MYVVIGLILLGKALLEFLLGHHQRQSGFSAILLVTFFVPVVFLWKRPKGETIPILLMSASILILANRWLFGYGLGTAAVGATFAVLTSIAGLMMKRISPLPKQNVWVWGTFLLILVATFSLFWLAASGISPIRR
jgi:hypothetical protein